MFLTCFIGFFVSSVSLSFGDNGGPLVVYQKGAPVLVGIASATEGCETFTIPNIHTRVSGFIRWLRGTPAVFATNL